MKAESFEDVHLILNEFEQQSKALTKQIYEICWYMRGGISREEAWALSTLERSEITSIINENIKRTKDSGIALL